VVVRSIKVNFFGIFLSDWRNLLDNLAELATRGKLPRRVNRRLESSLHLSAESTRTISHPHHPLAVGMRPSKQESAIIWHDLPGPALHSVLSQLSVRNWRNLRLVRQAT